MKRDPDAERLLEMARAVRRKWSKQHPPVPAFMPGPDGRLRQVKLINPTPPELAALLSEAARQAAGVSDREVALFARLVYVAELRRAGRTWNEVAAAVGEGFSKRCQSEHRDRLRAIEAEHEAAQAIFARRARR